MPFQNDIQKQNISLELDYLFTKYPMFLKKEDKIYAWRGMYLYAATSCMTLCFTILSFFLSTRNLHIDKTTR